MDLLVFYIVHLSYFYQR